MFKKGLHTAWWQHYQEWKGNVTCINIVQAVSLKLDNHLQTVYPSDKPHTIGSARGRNKPPSVSPSLETWINVKSNFIPLIVLLQLLESTLNWWIMAISKPLFTPSYQESFPGTSWGLFLKICPQIRMPFLWDPLLLEKLRKMEYISI